MGPDLSRVMRSSPYRPVFRHPILRRVLPGFAVSSLGDGMAVVAVSWLAIELAPAADRGIWVALAAASYTLSGAAGALLLGRFLRHRPPARLAGWDAALRAAALGAVPVLHAAGALGIEGYVALLAVSSLLHSWGQAGVHTLIARALPERDHLAGNAVLSGVGSIATVAGPPLATLLIVFGGPATVLAVDAATFLVLALTFLVAVPDHAVPEPEDAAASRTTGFTVIRRVPALSGLLALSFAFFFLFGPVYVALPLHVSDDLGASAGVLAAFYTAFGIGAVLGSVCTGFLGRWRMWPTTVGIVIAFGALMLPLGTGAPTTVSVVCFGAAGLLWPPYASLSTTLFQRSAPSAVLPQALAASSAVRVLSVPLGTALGGPLTAGLGAVGALRLSGAGIALVGVVAAALPALRAARPRPGPGAGTADPARTEPAGGPGHGESASADRRCRSMGDASRYGHDGSEPSGVAAARARLAADRADTLARAAALSRDFDGIVAANALVAVDDEHDPEGGTTAFERAHVAALMAQAREHLDELDQALRRLERGEYGRCEACGAGIAPERLEIRPAATTCVRCARSAAPRRPPHPA